MPDKNNEGVGVSSDTALVLKQINEIETSLKQEIDKITFGSLIGKWVSAHIATVGISSFATVATFACSIIFGSFWVSDHFVMAADLQGAIQQMQKDNALSTLEQRRWFLEQRLDDINSKSNPTADDRTRKQKIKDDLDKVDERIQKLQNPAHR